MKTAVVCFTKRILGFCSTDDKFVNKNIEAGTAVTDILQTSPLQIVIYFDLRNGEMGRIIADFHVLK